MENDESDNDQGNKDDAEDTSDEDGPDAPTNPERRLRSQGSVGVWSKLMGRVWEGAKLVTDESDRIRDELSVEDGLALDTGKAMLTKDGPHNIREALKDPKWREAIQKEYDQMTDVNAWDLVRLPPGKRALPFLWVLKLKVDEDTKSEEAKAQLVVHGGQQVAGQDYTSTFAPTPALNSFKFIMAI